MHEALVARVRYHIQKASFMGLKEAESTLLLGETADAIEELNILANNGEVAYDIMVRQTSYIEELQEKIPRWIPVTERLPEHGWYLAYGPTIKMEVLHFHSVEEVWSSERYYNIEVTHWMPLPEPPEEE